MAEPEKYYHKYPPCPLSDTEGIESWLEDLAREGLTLLPEAPFFGFLCFVKGSTQPVRYRMEPALKTQSFWSGDPHCPTEDAIELHEEFGWEFVIRLGEFFLYRSYDPQARELNTDPQIQEMTLRALQKKLRSGFLSLLVGFGLHLGFGVLGFPAGLLVALGAPTAVCFLLLMLRPLVDPLVLLLRLKEMRRRLKEGDCVHRKKNWHKGRLGYYAVRVGSLVLGLLFIVGFVRAQIRSSEKIPLEEFSGEVPFVTMADLAEGGSFTRSDSPWSNEVVTWTDPLIAASWDYCESGTFVTADGRTLSGYIDITYHEAASPGLARQLAKEFLRYADMGKYYEGTSTPDYDTGAVTVYTYQGRYGLNTLLMQCGSVVLEANIFLQDEHDQSAADLWIQEILQRLQNS